MIYIYNQTKTPWIIKSRQDKKGLLISKMKYLGKDSSGKRKHGFVRAACDNRLFDLSKKFESKISMGAMEEVSNEAVFLKFDRTDLTPIIGKSTNKGTNSALLLLSLFTGYDNVMNIESSDAYVINDMNVSDFFGQIVLFKNDDSYITITTYNSNTRTKITHTFIFNQGVLGHNIETEKVGECPVGVTHSRTFKPSMITTNVLVDEDQYENFLSVAKKREPTFSDFIIHKLNGNDDEILNKLKRESVRAITFYVPKGEEDSQEMFDRINNLKYRFRTFYLLYNSGIIKKIKIL